MIGKLIGIGTFVAFFLLTMALFPYVATQESYAAGATQIHDGFPIAVLEDGHPKIVSWTEYQSKLAHYKNHALVGAAKKEYAVDEFTSFVLSPEGNQTFSVDYRTDDYRFWSSYAVRDGIVRPISFRFTGAFSVVIGILGGLIGSALLAWIRKRHLSRRAGHR